MSKSKSIPPLYYLFTSITNYKWKIQAIHLYIYATDEYVYESGTSISYPRGVSSINASLGE